MSTINQADKVYVHSGLENPAEIPVANQQASRGLATKNVSRFYEQYITQKFFGSLDGLRALSILAVIWHHTGGSASLLPLGHQGKHGVTLFFVISGFLIATLILRAKEANTFDFSRFWWRRALRIMPVYFGVLALYVLLVFLLEKNTPHGREFFNNLVAFSTFTANWTLPLESERVIFYFAWSLAAEEQFYLVWPFIALYFGGMRAAFIAFAVLFLSQALMLQFSDVLPSDAPARLAACLPPGILLGTVLAYLLHNPSGFQAVWRIAGQRWSAPVAACASVVMLAFGHKFDPAQGLAVALPLAWLVAACVIREDNSLSSGLRLAPIVWIGKISFSMYLTHMLAVNLARRGMGMFGIHDPVVEFLTGTMLAAGVATMSYIWYESYFHRFKDRVPFASAR